MSISDVICWISSHQLHVLILPRIEVIGGTECPLIFLHTIIGVGEPLSAVEVGQF
jgi:hypothetical protein